MPSKPLFGIPVVVGMSEAVMATRSVPPPWAVAVSCETREARRGQDRGDEGAAAAAARSRDVEQGVREMVHVCASLAHG